MAMKDMKSCLVRQEVGHESNSSENLQIYLHTDYLHLSLLFERLKVIKNLFLRAETQRGGTHLIG